MACPYYSDEMCLIPENGMYLPLSIHREEYCLRRYQDCVRFKQARPSDTEKPPERRRFPRLMRIIPCAPAEAPGDPDCFTMDVSLGGVRVMTGERLEKGRRIGLWLYGPEKRPEVKAELEVRWQKPSFIEGWYETGLAFTPEAYAKEGEELRRVMGL